MAPSRLNRPSPEAALVRAKGRSFNPLIQAVRQQLEAGRGLPAREET